MTITHNLSKEVRLYACKRELLRKVPPGTPLIIPPGCDQADMTQASRELAECGENESMVSGEETEYVAPPASRSPWWAWPVTVAFIIAGGMATAGMLVAIVGGLKTLWAVLSEMKP